MDSLRIPKGTSLYHGTDCEGDFVIPDGPSWFTFAHDEAARWAGWSESLPQGRKRGLKRVLVTETIEDIDLVDVVSLERWEAVATSVCGDPEATSYAVADAFMKSGLVGWIGKHEIMLTTPALVLNSKRVVCLEAEAVALTMK
jgi:hypothetical protein